MMYLDIVEVFVNELSQALGRSRPLTKRTTVVMPLALYENLEVYALNQAVSKNQVIEMVLSEFLSQNGFRPYERPKVAVSY